MGNKPSENSELRELKVRFKKVRPEGTVPAYATAGAAAADLRAALEAPLSIFPGERAVVPTGIAIALEDPTVAAFLFARSGLACKKGICLANGVGVIDSDYRGEIGVALQNNGKEPFTVMPGDRIAQLCFMPVCQAQFVQAEELSETTRGAGGFGSTGVS